MGLFNFFKNKKKNQKKKLDDFYGKMRNLIFPNGKEDMIIWCTECNNILNKKIDKKIAENFFFRLAGRCYIELSEGRAFEMSTLNKFLSKNGLLNLNNKELNELHILLLDMQNKIQINQFFEKMPKEMKELFFSELKTNPQACDTDEIPNTIGQFGLSPTNPVPVHFIPSNDIYLGRLRTKDGQPIKWERDGSLSIPSIEKSVDKYKIFDSTGKFLTHIYISPYHKKTSKKAPKGFEIVGGYTDDSTAKENVVLCDSSENFYDKMFDKFAENFFLIAQHKCFVQEKNIHASGEVVGDDHTQKTKSIIAGYAFLWLCNLSNQNLKLYKHILSIASKNHNENVSNEDKKVFIKSIFGKNIEQIFSDTKAVNAIFVRASAYNLLINRLTNALLSFYSEHGNDEDIKYFLLRANNDFEGTAYITDIDKITIYDVDKIFVRDMLGGKKIVDYKNNKDSLIENTNNTTDNLDISKIKRCIDVANDYLQKNDYNTKDYSIDDCYDLISLWKEKGLPEQIHLNFGPQGGGFCGFDEETSMECLSKWHKILTGKEIPISQRKYYLSNYQGGLTSGCKATNKLLQDINFNLSEIVKHKDSKPIEKKENISFSSKFVDENGEPMLLQHNCLSERIGKEMTKEELHKFAVELLTDLYENAGMTIVNVNRNYHREFPNIVMKSRNGKLYYVIIETACYPQKAESLYSADFTEMKQYAKEFNATPVFAGMSFMNASRELEKLVCGDSYFVAFKGLEAI